MLLLICTTGTRRTATCGVGYPEINMNTYINIHITHTYTHTHIYIYSIDQYFGAPRYPEGGHLRRGLADRNMNTYINTHTRTIYPHTYMYTYSINQAVAPPPLLLRISLLLLPPPRYPEGGHLRRGWERCRVVVVDNDRKLLEIRVNQIYIVY